MNRLLRLVARLASARGQTMAEYAVVVVWVGLLVVVAVTAVGHSLTGIFHSTATKL